MRSIGADLLNRIHAGEFQPVSSEHVEKARVEISAALEELLDIGARIRPLYIDGRVDGWVRGIHLAERKVLDRWIHDPYDLAVERLLLATSLTREEIEGLTGSEICSVIRLVNEMSESDIRLFPYMSAFVSTSISEQMWFARGTEITKYQRREVTLPGGGHMVISTPPDHTRLWANLCHYREVAKERLDRSMNSLIVVRPTAGRSADGFANELRNTAKLLLTDSLEPWKEVVRSDQAVDLNDGWAHGGDDSVESLKRELAGMAANDRHEQLIAKFEKQELERAEAEKQKREEIITRRGGPGMVSRVKPMTEAEAGALNRKLRSNRPAAVAGDEVEQSTLDRLRKYR